MAKKYEIIKGFDANRHLFEIPDMPLQDMVIADAILLEDNPGTNIYRLQSMWRQRVTKLCGKKKLKASDFKVSKKGDQLYLVRVYESKIPE